MPFAIFVSGWHSDRAVLAGRAAAKAEALAEEAAKQVGHGRAEWDGGGVAGGCTIHNP